MPHYDGDPEVADFVDTAEYDQAHEIDVEDLEEGMQFPSHDGKTHEITSVEHLDNGDVLVSIKKPSYNAVFTGGTKTQVL